MTSSEPTTAKGRSTAARILAAATIVLARDGMGGATLGRIADEAGVDKRNITYYYGSREALLVRVLQAVGERLAAGIEATLTAVDAQGARPSAEALWAEITAEPQFVRAYITFLGGSAETPEIDVALAELKQTWVRMVARRLGGSAEAARTRALLILAVLRGIALEWAETGDGPVVSAGLRHLEDLFSAGTR